MDIELYNRFCEAADLNKQHSPYLIRRESGKEYGWFLIIKCRYEEWWYRDFIGIEFMGEIEKNYTTYRETEVRPVRLTNTKVHRGRQIPINDLILL